jgi:hypothetical protein
MIAQSCSCALQISELRSDVLRPSSTVHATFATFAAFLSELDRNGHTLGLRLRVSGDAIALHVVGFHHWREDFWLDFRN